MCIRDRLHGASHFFSTFTVVLDLYFCDPTMRFEMYMFKCKYSVFSGFLDSSGLRLDVGTRTFD